MIITLRIVKAPVARKLNGQLGLSGRSQSTGKQVARGDDSRRLTGRPHPLQEKFGPVGDNISAGLALLKEEEKLLRLSLRAMTCKSLDAFAERPRGIASADSALNAGQATFAKSDRVSAYQGPRADRSRGAFVLNDGGMIRAAFLA